MSQEIYPPDYGIYKEPSVWVPVHKDATITVKKPSAIVVGNIFLLLAVVCLLAGIILYFVTCNGFFDYIVHLFTVLLPWIIGGIICLCLFAFFKIAGRCRLGMLWNNIRYRLLLPDKNTG